MTVFSTAAFVGVVLAFFPLFILGADVWINLNESENYVARHECSFIQAGDKFYLFGGREHGTRLDRYDYATNTWDVGATVPKELNHFQAVTYQGLIWVIGAFSTNNYPNEVPERNVYVYDPANNVWMKGPSIPLGRRRGGAGLVVYNETFYSIGGNTLGHNGGTVPYLDSFDPRMNAWAMLANAPNPRDHFSAVTVGDAMYNIGGRASDLPNVFDNTIAKIDVYNFTTGSWTTLAQQASLPVPRAGTASVYFEGKILTIGGESSAQKKAYSRVDAFDPLLNTIAPVAPMNYMRHGTQALVSGAGVFITAGSPSRGGGNQRNMEVYGKYDPVGYVPIPGTLRGPFGTVKVRIGRVQTITITHSAGNTGVLVNSLAFQGRDASDFTILFLSNGPFLIGKGETRQLSITYTGIKASASASLKVTYSSGSSLAIPLKAINSEYNCFPAGPNGSAMLKAAVSDYITNGTASLAAQTYGPRIGSWCVDRVTSFEKTFHNQKTFNESLHGWNTSSATAMAMMFAGAWSFNQNLSFFDTSKVTNMDRMFLRAKAFTGIGLVTWDVSKVKSMYKTFKKTTFNQPIAVWDVQSVNDATEMFRYAATFNQNLCAWGSKLSSTIPSSRVSTMFQNTSCRTEANPNLSATPRGPFCAIC